MARYISCADTAKLVRKALKKAFPGRKFSVRSKTYSGGASVTVGWTDGPTSKAVDEVVGTFSGASFDGMIDLKSYHDSELKHEDGTAETVHYGANYVFTRRAMSDAARARIIAELEAAGVDTKTAELVPFSVGRVWTDEGRTDEPMLCSTSGRGDYVSGLVRELFYGRSA